MSLTPTVEQLRSSHTPALYLPESERARELLDAVDSAERSVRTPKSALQGFVGEELEDVWARTLDGYGLGESGRPAVLRLKANSLMVNFINWQPGSIKLFDELWQHGISSYPGSHSEYESCPPREPLERVWVTVSDRYHNPQPIISIEDQYGLGVVFSSIDRAEAYATRTFARRAAILSRHWDNLHPRLYQEAVRVALVFLLEEAKELRFKPEIEPKHPRQNH